MQTAVEPLSAADPVLDWPLPPGFQVDSESPQPRSEGCEILLRSGELRIGRALAVRSDDRCVVFMRRGASVPEHLAFEQIKLLRLPRTLRLIANQALRAIDGVAKVQNADFCTFALLFADGQLRSGDTTGHVNRDNGLYLFPGTGPDCVERWFVPREAVSSFTLGSLTGELLVRESGVSEANVNKALEIQREIRERPIGEYLLDEHIVNLVDLERALDLQKSMPVLRLGDALVQLGLVTPEQLADAIGRQRAERHRPLGEILITMGVVSDNQIKHVLARKLGIPFVDVRHFEPEYDALQRVPPAFALRQRVLPLHRSNEDLAVAMEDPMDSALCHELRVMTGLHILPVISTREAIARRVDQFYGNGAEGLRRLEEQQANALPFHIDANAKTLSIVPTIQRTKATELVNKLFEEGSALELVRGRQEDEVSESDNTLVQLVNKMITDARTAGVSDIHIETNPGRQNSRVRFRKDAILTEYLQVPHGFRAALVSRLKIMASLDISERRKPQDGKIEFGMAGSNRIELRVATIPTNQGLEDVVMRILASSDALPMVRLGLESDALEALTRLAEKPHGLLLVCGPTGSGKTTTLHSVLSHINTPQRKIWTAEDPVEITQAGLRQVQVNPKLGWTFAHAMRAFLRADPDVVMVGEMRDAETTRSGIEASLTGHLVLSTLHTNSACESVIRLLDLGMDPFNFSDALLGVLGQRLVRHLCPACRQPYFPAADEVRSLAEEYCHETALVPDRIIDQWVTRFGAVGELKIYLRQGCDQCQHTGYNGRVGIHELLVNTPRLKRMIQSRAPVEQIVTGAIEGGMRTLKQDGLLKVLKGITDAAQVRAVCN